MPILVQWAWQENTKSFLVIFHFYDDFSKPNLRVKSKKLADFPDVPKAVSTLVGPKDRTVLRPIMTWAPSHVELALLSDLLHYANIIDGFSEETRRYLRYDLEITVSDGDGTFGTDVERMADLDRRFIGSHVIMAGTDGISKKGCERVIYCIELSSQYIEYLREILKPYLSG